MRHVAVGRADGAARVTRFDLVVVGGGSAGLVAALGAAGLGARVALVEADRTGGECLWTGCVPSKSLLAAADLTHRMRHADGLGLPPTDPTVDLAAVMGRVRDAQRRLAEHDAPERLREEGVTVIHGRARFTRPGELRIEGTGQTVRWRRALVATGSTPLVPDVPGLAKADPLTSDTVWGLDTLPSRLLVVGGGAVGCELGQAFARLGSHVTLVEAASRLLPAEEPEAGALLAQRLTGEGVDVRLDTQLASVAPAGDGHRVSLDHQDAQAPAAPVAVDRILVAVGRRPRSDDLGLEAVGVATDAGGAVVTDEGLRTTGRGVVAAGDVTGAPLFTHVAAHQAGVAVGNALFGLRRTPSTTVPRVVFTAPEVAAVGIDEAEARRRWGQRAVITSFDYGELDRAVCAGEPFGFAKLVGDPRGRLVGGTVAAPAGGEAVAELTAWISQAGTIGDLFTTVHAYPTFAEGPARAAIEHFRRRWFTPRTRRFTRPALALARLLDRPR